ncbi:MAG: nitrate ABC transporter ATP-binding protein [Kiritimatiellae bacterium]|nr:nitrate ABC transporter ATP-binding protein [Kiritimatiellia bacterium]
MNESTPFPCLELHDVQVHFGKGRDSFHAIDETRLSIREGEFVSLIGHSGCGKSTLLNVFAGFIQPSHGHASLLGQPIRSPGPDRMMVFQNHSLLPWMSVRANVDMAARAVFPDLPKTERRVLVAEQLEQVGLTAAADKQPGQISGGMKQRAGIARALITRPRVLLMDEPFGALDALTRGKLQDALLEIWEKNRITVVMVTHDVDEALLLSDRVVMMNNGPAATIGEILDIDLPRPRNRVDTVNHPLYYRYRNHLTGFLRANRKTGPDPRNSMKSPDTLTLGFVPLSDAAPLLMARELGIFEEFGLKVELSREPSWRTVSKGVMSGRLDAAMMLAPTPLRHNLNPATTPELEFTASMVLSRNGNGITLHKKLMQLGVTDRESFAAFVKRLPPNRKPTLGVVFNASMHNLMLRDWLVNAGLDPDRDVKILVIPPPQLLANLEFGNILGFCAGEPWNSMAVQRGIGFVPATSLTHWSGHPEKVLGYLRAKADTAPETYEKLTAALLQANAYCADPQNRIRLVETLSRRDGVNVPAAVFRDSLFDRFDNGIGEPEAAPGFHAFPVGESARPDPRAFRKILGELVHWNCCPAPADPETALTRAMDPGTFDRATAGTPVLPDISLPVTSPEFTESECLHEV